jgi:hypothetical protein
MTAREERGSSGRRAMRMRVDIEELRTGRPPLRRAEDIYIQMKLLDKLAIAAIGKLRDSDQAELAQAERELGLASLNEDPTSAEKHLRTAIDLYEGAEEPVELAATYRALGDLVRTRGDERAAGDLYRTGIMVMEERL